MIFEEKTLSSERIYEGKILNLRVDQVTVLTGTSKREIIEHGGAAVIVALTEDNSVIMVRQFRKPVERVVFELPAGKIDRGEKPEETAVRELKEETGFRAGNMKLLTKMYPTVGYSEEALYIYLATELSEGMTNFDENEALDIESWKLEDLVEMVMKGKIEDGKTQVGILMVNNIVNSSKKAE